VRNCAGAGKASSATRAEASTERYNLWFRKPVIMTLDVKDKAPAFTVPNQDGNPVSLKDFSGQPVVLFFFPKADTPG